MKRALLLCLLLAGCALQPSSSGVTRTHELLTTTGQLFAYDALASYTYAVTTTFGTVTVRTDVTPHPQGYLLNTTATLGTYASQSAMAVDADGACLSLVRDGADAPCPGYGLNSNVTRPLLFAGMTTVGYRTTEEYVADDVHYYVVPGAPAPVRIDAEGSVFTLTKTVPLKS